MTYLIYILRCRDGSLYTGITNDLEKRLREHSLGKGSRYVRSRLPFRLVHTESLPDRPRALRRESQIKGMSRRKKLSLIMK